MTEFPKDYRARVYAGWLGKCIGVRLGVPVETWTYREIADHLGELQDYIPLPPGKIFKPDDDTAFPMVLIRALQDFGADVTAEQIGSSVLNYLGDRHGTLWWGGYGISTEHTAYENLAGGIPAPRSGSIEINGRALAEQIGGQIFSDIWGLVAPNDPLRAAALAEKASSVTHDGEGIHGGRFIAALVSAAFGEKNPAKLIDAGLDVIPYASEYARVTRAVLEYHRANPRDWRACYQHLGQNFGYDRYPGAVPIIPNAGVVVMALLYGEGDFSRAIQIATNAGWDTDCNAGNVGCIMGIAAGIDGIDPRWRAPVNDIFVAASLIGANNLWTISAATDLFAWLGEQTHYVPVQALSRFHFEYPGATHGFQSESDQVVGVRQVQSDGRGVLQISVNDLRKKGELRVFARTYFRPSELSANYYGASFSPQIYPGQTITTQLYLPEDAPEGLLAALYAWDDNHRVSHQASGSKLKAGAWQTLSYQIPPLENALFTRVGIVMRNLGESWRGHILLDDFDWHGAAQLDSDFKLDHAEYGAISGWTYLRGFWRLEDGAYHGSGIGICESYSGDPAWTDLAVSADLVPLAGEHHYLNVRVQGARRSYAFGLAPEGKVVLSKNRGQYTPVAGAPFEWRHGQRYTIGVQVIENSFSLRVDGKELLVWRDDDKPYLRGQIGLSTREGGHLRCERISVRGVSGKFS